MLVDAGTFDGVIKAGPEVIEGVIPVGEAMAENDLFSGYQLKFSIKYRMLPVFERLS